MPNIFDGLRQISDNNMIEQVALLETMNISNISKPVIQKAKKKTINIINFIGSKFGKNNMIEEPEVKEIWTLIDEKKEELLEFTREQLEERLFEVLREKCKDDGESKSEDALSIEIIEEAAKLYKLYKNSTPAQKADAIYSKYDEKLKGKAMEYINEQPFIDLQETTEDIEEIIKNMEENQKKELLQSVDVEKLTLLNVWKKIDRQHFSRLVWMSVKALGGAFTPKEKILPSYIDKENESEIIEKEEDLKKSQEELSKLKNEMETCQDRIAVIENNLDKENRILNKAFKDKNEAEEDIVDLEKIGSKLEAMKKSREDKLDEIKRQMENVALEELEVLMEDFKVVKFEIVEINNKISDTKFEIAFKKQITEDNIKLIENKEKSIKEIVVDFQQLKVETDTLITAYNQKRAEVHKKEDIIRSEIFERWSKFFNKFIFEFKELKNVVNFSRKELLQIESCLYELHFSIDPMALSMGVIENKEDKEEYEYLDASYPDKFQVEIHYKVLDNEDKRIKIVGITTEL
ncbi:hypothetical protein [Clostridium sp. C2-6-12]|uniref:coiled-coil domain-containing protein n=1 Tax=Clostridium sp. C2-6-12 TaxID=2698832 RepID=UPI0013717B2E|nr:hypothetical protein [Clostridium sp. C2-6-12]